MPTGKSANCATLPRHRIYVQLTCAAGFAVWCNESICIIDDVFNDREGGPRQRKRRICATQDENKKQQREWQLLGATGWSTVLSFLI